MYPPPSEVDLSQEADTAPRLEPWTEVTDREIQNAIFTSSPKKAPGPDLLAFRIIQQAYKIIPGILNKLYTTVLHHGYHPTSWRQGIGAILKKSGDRDSQLPKSYRIITLLNCLGKVAEKILATRLSYLGPDILDNDQMRGRKHQSAIDAVMAMVHDINRNGKEQ